MADVVGQRPINLQTLDRQLALLRDTPGLRVRRAELQPDLGDPSAHILVLDLAQERAGGYLRADNRGSDDYGGWRIIANAEAYGWLRAGDEAGLHIATAPTEPERMRAFELSYAAPLGGEGASVRVEAGAGRSIDDDGEVRDIHSASIRYQWPLHAGRDAERALFIEAAGLTIEETDAGAATTDETLLSLAAGLTGRWRSGWGVTSYYGQALIGQASSPLDSLRSRLDADDQYARLNLSMLHRASFGEDLAMSLRLAAQLSDGPLPRSHEMAAGGRLFGRAYRYGGVRGDSGVAGSLETRYIGLPEAPLFGQPQPYFFIDGASVFNGYFGDARQDNLASWGAGLRFTLFDQMSLEVELARALIDAEAGEGWRQNFNMHIGF